MLQQHIARRSAGQKDEAEQQGQPQTQERVAVKIPQPGPQYLNGLPPVDHLAVIALTLFPGATATSSVLPRNLTPLIVRPPHPGGRCGSAYRDASPSPAIFVPAVFSPAVDHLQTREAIQDALQAAAHARAEVDTVAGALLGKSVPRAAHKGPVGVVEQVQRTLRPAQIARRRRPRYWSSWPGRS